MIKINKNIRSHMQNNRGPYKGRRKPRTLLGTSEEHIEKRIQEKLQS
jgi:hypothetical protein